MTFAKRFTEARNSANLSVADIAKRLKISVQSVYLWEQGSIPKAARVNELASILGVTAQWLIYGSGENVPSIRHEDGSLTVPYLVDVPVSAGGGGFGVSHPSIKLIDLDSQWVQDNLPHVSTRSLAILTICGDSMSPTFEDGDTILIDQSRDRIDRDGLYVVIYDNMVFSKRFQVIPGGKVLMLSDNKLYREIEIDLKDESIQLKVVGQIFFSWHGVKH